MIFQELCNTLICLIYFCRFEKKKKKKKKKEKTMITDLVTSCMLNVFHV